jgi:hypothetical protein
MTMMIYHFETITHELLEKKPPNQKTEGTVEDITGVLAREGEKMETRKTFPEHIPTGD